MTTLALIADLAKQDILLWLDNEELKFSAPKGALTDDHRQMIVAHKSEIINYLAEAKRIKDSQIKPVPRNGTLPLSPSQESLWFVNQLDGESSAYNLLTSIPLRQELDVALLEKTLQVLTRRHESLRTRFVEQDGVPVQVIDDAYDIQLVLLDLADPDNSKLTEDEKDAEVDKLITAEENHSFDLSKGPLFRFKLVRLAEDNYLFIVNAHHIMFDAWSMGVLTREIIQLYQALLAKQEPPFTPLAIQFGDYAHWQNNQMKNGGFSKQLEYWQHQLKGAPALLQIATDFPRPFSRDYRGLSYAFNLDKSLTEKLIDLARRENVTLYSTLLVVFKIVLARYSGQDDIVVGMPAANRAKPETQNLVGYFVNTLAIRTKIDNEVSFPDLIKSVQSVTKEALSNQDIPFSVIVSELVTERSLSFEPLCQTTMVYKNADMGADFIDGEAKQYSDNDGEIRGKSKDDLSLQFRDVQQGLSGKLTYRASLFRPETMQRFVEHFVSLIERVCENPEVSVNFLLGTLPPEQERLLERWQVGDNVTYDPRFLHQMVEYWSEVDPERVALVSEQSSLTYGALNRLANRLARRLLNEGVVPEQSVAFSANRSETSVIAFIGILKAGAVCVAIDPAYPDARQQFMLQDCKAKLFLTQEQSQAALDVIDVKIISLEAILTADDHYSDTNLDVAIQQSNLAYVVYTSGSTGLPKGVMVTHSGIYNLARSQVAKFAVKGSSRILQFASISFDAAVSEFAMTMLQGASLYLLNDDQVTPDWALNSFISNHQISHFTMPPSALAVLPAENLKQVETVISAGESCSINVAKKWCQEHVFVNAYGPSEVTVCATMERVDSRSEESVVNIGDPITNSAVYIVDPLLRRVPIGVTGEICISGIGLARGYLNRADLTAEKFISDPFSNQPGQRLYRSGDLGRYRGDGKIEYIGRKDYQVKLRGYRIELDEIASVLTGHESVRDAVVIERSNQKDESVLVAYVVDEVGKQSNPEELRKLAQTKLPDYMIPAAFQRLAALPLTPNGKVDRDRLPRHEFAKNSEFVSPGNEVEKAISRIWCGLLNLKSISIGDDFFSLGGHSLLIIQVGARIRDDFNVVIVTRELFENPTIAQQAKLVEQKLATTHPQLARVTPVSETQKQVLSFVQQRLWFISQLEQTGAAYHLPLVLRLQSAHNTVVIEAALQEIVNRHESLRTIFFEKEGQTRQKIIINQTIDLPIIDLTKQELSLQQKEDKAKEIVGEDIIAPFNLTVGPLVRFKLVKLSREESILSINMHHIISDGWSVGVFVKELGILLHSFSEGRKSPLLPLAVQYGDYSHWQRKMLQGDRLSDQLNYWTQQLADLPPLLELPADRVRPAIQSYRGATLSFNLSESLTGRLNELSKSENATLFMTLLTGFNILLSRYSGQSDIAVGTPVANRNSSDLEAMIGFFVNTVVLRNNVGNRHSFRSLLKTIKQTCIAAYSHPDIPFEKLVELLNPERSLSHSPLFQVMFSQENPIALNDLAWEGMSFEPLRDENATAKFDLSLSFIESKTGIACFFEYSTDLFDASTIERFAKLYQVLLESIVEEPSRLVGELSLLGDADKRQLLIGWNDNLQPFQSEMRIHELFEKQVKQVPENLAVQYKNQGLTYRVLNEKANQLARFLNERGVAEESRVGVCLPRSERLVVAMLAILKAGGAYVPLDPDYPAERLKYMLDDAKITEVISLSSLTLDLTASQISKICLDDDETQHKLESMQKSDLKLARHGRTSNHLAYVIYTSGSTGRPKGVSIEHRSTVAMINWAHRYYKAEQLKVVLASTSVCFDLSVFEIFVPLAIGGATCIVDNVLALGEQELQVEISLVNTVPSALKEIVSFNCLPASVQVVNVAGEALTRDIATRFYAAYPNVQLINLYGPSEDTTYSTISQISANEQRAPLIGRPIDNGKVYILDSNLQPVPIGVPGELYVAGEGVARGYLARPTLTAERFLPNPYAREPGERLYKTEDWVRYLANGEIEYLGRVDHQVKIRGFRVEIGEIEARLIAIPAVSESVVIAHEDELRGKNLVAYIVPSTTSEPDNEQLKSEIQQTLGVYLPEYMVPKLLVFLNKMPLTANGKIDRKALPYPHLSHQPTGQYVASRTKNEALLVAIWQELLGVEKVGVKDNFFELGGHSLMALSMVNAINETSNVKIALHSLFESPTIEKLALILESQRQKTDDDEVLQPLIHDEDNRYQPFPLTDIQQAYWLGRTGQFQLGNVGTHTYQEMDFEEFDVKSFEKTFNRLIQRHDMMRMVVNEQGQQRILPPDVFYPIQYSDFSQLSEEGREAALIKIRDEMSHHIFAADQWPLFDIRVNRIGEKSYRLYWSLDALILDGASQQILSKELHTLKDDPDLPLPELDITFRDYVLAEQQLRQTRLYAGSKSYWLKRIDNFALAPELPMAIDPAKLAAPVFKRRQFRMEKSAWEKLKGHAGKQGVTPSGILLTAFAEVLRSWSKRRDFTLNLTVFNRLPLHEQINDILGDFTSSTLLEMKCEDSDSFSDRCRTAQKQLWNDLEHRYFNGVEVLRELRRMRDDHSAIDMPVVFTSMLGITKGSETDEADGIDDSDEGYGVSQTSQVWLDHQVIEVAGALETNWDAVEDLFPCGMLDAMFGAYQSLLYQLAEDEALWAQKQISLLPQEQKVVRCLANNTQAAESGMLLHQGFEQQVIINGQRNAVLTSSIQITYQTLNNAANALAKRLQARGARPNKLIAFVMHKGWEQIVASLAIIKSGAAYLPIDASLPPSRVEQILQQGEVDLVICQTVVNQTMVWPQAVNTLEVDESCLKATVTSNLPASQKSSDLAYVIFTSGSTGVPKGVMIDHRGAVNTIEAINKKHLVTSGDRVLGVSSMSFDLSVYDVFGLLSAGGAVVLPDSELEKDPAHWYDLIKSHQVSMWNTVPALMQMLVEYLESKSVSMPTSLREVMLSGDWIPLTLAPRVKALCNSVSVTSMGGATEASIWSIAYQINEIDPSWKSIPYGKPLPNQTYHVLKSDLIPCPDWVPGDLYIGGIGLAKGYWSDEEKTRASFITIPVSGEALYYTGDLGRYYPDGNIEFLGREDSQVKIQGYRIELGDIEAALNRNEMVRESVVVVHGEKANGKRLVGYVLLERPPGEQEQPTENPDTEDGVLSDPLERTLFKLSQPGLRRFTDIHDVIALIRDGYEEGYRQTFFNGAEHAAIKFENRAIGLTEFSRLLSCLAQYKVEGAALPKYVYPSGGSLNPVQIYIEIDEHAVENIGAGCYYYDPEAHQLVKLSDGGKGTQQFRLYLISDNKAIAPLYGKFSQQLSQVEAGYIKALLLASAPDNNIGLCSNSQGVNHSILNANFALTEQHRIVDTLCGGYLRQSDNVSLRNSPAIARLQSAIALPEFALTETIQIGSLERQSYRSFVNDTLDLHSLAQVLGGLDSRLLEDLAVYLYIKPQRVADLQGGYYIYDAASHSLILKCESDDIPATRYQGANAKVFEASAFAIYIVGQHSKSNLLNSGMIGQRMMSFCTKVNLGLCPIGDFGSTGLHEILSVNQEHEFLHSFLGGMIQLSQTMVWAQQDEAPNAASPMEMLKAFLTESLPQYMVPSIIIPLDKIPLTANGKVNRKALPEPDFETEIKKGYVAAATYTELQLAVIWQELLKVEKVGMHDNFFQLGGHSIIAVQAVNKIADVTGIRITLRNLFDSPTIAEIAVLIDQHDESAPEIEELPKLIHDAENRYAPFPLTDVQQAYWLGRSGAFELGNVSTHSYSEMNIEEFEVNAFEKIFNRLIQRHDMMRMIVDRDGQQRVLKSVPYYQIDYLDLSGQEPAEVNDQLFRRREEMSHQVLPTDVWPLFDVRVIKLPSGIFRLYWSMDMLLLDGGSQQLLSKGLYDLKDDPEQPMPPLEITFRDYVMAEQSLRESEIYKRSKRYWVNRIESLSLAPELPLAKDPSMIKEPKFERRAFSLEAPLWDKLKNRARHYGVTPSVFLVTLFGEVLGTWSKKSDFTLNLTIFNRLPFHEQVYDLIGDFTSLTLLELKRYSDENFVERCRTVQKQLWSDLENKYFSGIEVLRELRRHHGDQKSISMPVVFTSMLDLEGAGTSGATTVEIDDDDEEDYGISQTSQVWLDHQVTESNGVLHGNWDAVEDLFPAGVLDAMFSAYVGALHRLVDDEPLWQSLYLDLIPLTQTQRHKKVNATAAEESGLLLHQGFENQVEKQPLAHAVLCAERQISYETLNSAANGLALDLLKANAKVNQLIAVVMAKGWEQVAAVLAVLKAGAAYLPIDATLPLPRIEQILKQGKVDLVITQPEYDRQIEWPADIQRFIVDESRLESEVIANPPVLQAHSDLAYVIFTSGSTGTPKGVMIDHRGAVNTVETINRKHRVEPADRVLALSSLSFDLSVYDIFGLLAAGGAIVIPDAKLEKDPDHWRELLIKHQVSLWNTVPALMQILVDYYENNQLTLPASLRDVMMSGDWIPLSLPTRIRALTKDISITSLGGATEASIWSIDYQIEQVEPSWKSIPYGMPLDNQSYHVLKKDLSPCPDWVSGDLYIGGIGLAKGYWRDADKTAASFITHPHSGESLYYTGDLGRYLPDGHIEFLGREDSQVKIQGYRIELGEIESVLNKSEMVKESVVVAYGETVQNRYLFGYVALVLPPEALEQQRHSEAAGEGLLDNPIEQSLFKLSQPGLRLLADETATTLLERNGYDEGLLQVFVSNKLQSKMTVRNEAIKFTELSRLLIALSQISVEDAALPKYFYPSVGSLNPVQAYLEIPQNSIEQVEGGYYYYDPVAHRLMKLSGWQSESQQQRGFRLFLVSARDAVTPIYGDDADPLSEIESGYISELLHASAMGQHIGMQACELSKPDSQIRQQFLLQENHLVLQEFYLQAILPDYLPQSNDMTNEIVSKRPVDHQQIQLPDFTLSHQQRLGMFERQSYRKFSQDLIPLQQFAQLLGCWDARFSRDVQLYVHLKAERVEGLSGGYYRFAPAHQTLTLITLSAEVPQYRYGGGNAGIFEQAAFALFLVDSSRDVAQSRRSNFAAGAIGQRLTSRSPQLKIGLCPIGGFNDKGLDELLGLHSQQRVIHSFLGGAIEPLQTLVWTYQDESQLALPDPKELLREYLLEHLPQYMVPKRFMILDKLPLSSNGKIDRKALPEPDMQSEPQRLYVAAETSLEKQLAAIWQEVLEIDKIGIDDQFFELGGNSLKAVQVQTRLRVGLNVDLELRELYENPTIRDAAKIIENSNAKTAVKDEGLSVSAIKAASIKKQQHLRLSQMSDEEVAALLKSKQAKKKISEAANE